MNSFVTGAVAALAAVTLMVIVRDVLAICQIWREHRAGLDRLGRFC